MAVDPTKFEALLEENRVINAPPEFKASATIADPSVYEKAETDPEGFWASFARELEWAAPWTKVLEWTPPVAKWFVGGKINASVNCVDRHLKTSRRNKAAIVAGGGPTIHEVVVLKREGLDTPVTMKAGRDQWYHDLMKPDVPAWAEPEAMDAEDLLYILYTSGTTGKPKGIVHTTGGYLVGTYATTKLVFDLRDDDVYWCTADIGWVTGHSYVVYGPLANGATVLMYEGAPDWPQKDRFWSMIDRHGVTVFYTAPTAIRAFMRWGTEWPKTRDLSSLRLLGSVGEPINPEAWVWYYRFIGGERCPVVDTWWQTETGAIMITPLPGVTTLKPGSATKPFPGISAEIRNERGETVEVGGGLLALTRPWPSMLRGIYGDPDRYVTQYWNKWGSGG